MDQDRLRQAQRIRDAANQRPYSIEPTVLDERGNPIARPDNWGKHPQMRQKTARRLEPWNDEPTYDQSYTEHQQIGRDRDGVNVSVNNNGQMYRPMREELWLSGWKTFGNFLAFPFRLVQSVIQGAANSLVGLMGFIIKILIIPTVFFIGLGIYQTGRDRPAAETAQIVGKESVGVIGGLMKGIWSGVFGSGNAEPENKNAGSNNDPAPKGKTGQ